MSRPEQLQGPRRKRSSRRCEAEVLVRLDDLALEPKLRDRLRLFDPQDRRGPADDRELAVALEQRHLPALLDALVRAGGDGDRDLVAERLDADDPRADRIEDVAARVVR